MIPIRISWSKAKGFLIAGGIVYLLLHFFPYFSPRTLPSPDYANLGTTLTYLSQPELFQGEGGVVSTVYAELLTASPLYYYPAGFLARFVHPLLVPKVFGLVLATISFLLAGGEWKSWNDGLRAVVVTVVFIHLAGSVNPLLGNKRSITLPILLFALHPISRKLTVRLFVLALAASIYPQAGLLLLTYLGIRFLTGEAPFNDSTSLVRRCLSMGTHIIVFVLALSPILFDTLFTSTGSVAHDLTAPLYERWNTSQTTLWESWRGIYLIFITGARSAFFRMPSTLVMFAVFTTFSLLAFLITGRSEHTDFKFPVKLRHLLFTGLFLWGFAHLTHPLIHHPFKYTRVTLPLAVIFLFLANLNSLVRLTHSRLKQRLTIRRIILVIGFFSIIAYGISLWYFPTTFYRGNTTNQVYWPGILSGAIILLAGISLISPEQKIEMMTIMAVTLFLFFYPHYFGNYSRFLREFESLRKTTPMFKTIKRLPKKATIAGPPMHMNWVPVFGKREVYLNQKRRSIDMICDRLRSFKTVYFAKERAVVAQYFDRRPISHVLIDRGKFNGLKYASCRKEIRMIGQHYLLDRSYEDHVWQGGDRFYLLTPTQLLKQLPESVSRNP